MRKILPTILPTLFFGCVTEFDYYTTTVVYAFVSFFINPFLPTAKAQWSLVPGSANHHRGITDSQLYHRGQ